MWKRYNLFCFELKNIALVNAVKMKNDSCCLFIKTHSKDEAAANIAFCKKDANFVMFFHGKIQVYQKPNGVLCISLSSRQTDSV